MNKEIAEKWIADLRTDPPQTKGILFDGKGYCCLGRLCVVLGIEPVKDEYGNYTFDEDTMSLSHGIAHKAGMCSRSGQPENFSDIIIDNKHYDNLTAVNDKGISFPIIADWIEKNWEQL